MENEWASAIQSGKEIQATVNVVPPGSIRPDSFDVIYKIIDPKTGNVLQTRSKTFKNQAGEEFKRQPFRGD